MSLSLFQKAHVLVAANAHDLLDHLVDMNSPSSLREYIRMLDNAIASVKGNVATNIADTKSCERELKDLHDREAALTGQEQLLVQNGKDDSAIKTDVLLQAVEAQIKPKETQHETLLKARAALDQTISALEAKRQAMQGQLDQLEALRSQRQGLEAGAAALAQANAVAESVDGSSLDELTNREQHRLDVAQAKFDMQNNAVVDTVGQDVAQATAAERIAQLKARLAQQGTPTPA